MSSAPFSAPAVSVMLEQMTNSCRIHQFYYLKTVKSVIFRFDKLNKQLKGLQVDDHSPTSGKGKDPDSHLWFEGLGRRRESLSIEAGIKTHHKIVRE